MTELSYSASDGTDVPTRASSKARERERERREREREPQRRKLWAKCL